MPTTPILEITNGTDTVNLLARHEGFFHLEWSPAVAEFKDGGIFADNPLLEGRSLVFSRFANATESIVVNLRANSPNELANSFRDLRNLVNKANKYWSDDLSVDLPVYLRVRGSGESSIRYAVIHHARVSGDPNPFSMPWHQPDGATVATEIELQIERGHWLDQAPFSATTIPATVISTKGPDVGNVDGSGDRSSAYATFFANKAIERNIDFVYYHQTGGSVTNTNLQTTSSPPTTYMPNAIQSGDRLYVGCDDAPFANIILPYNGLLNGTCDLSVSYWDGSAWNDLSTSYDGADLTNSADNRINLSAGSPTAVGFTWRQPEDWADDTLVNVSGDGGAASTGNVWWIKLEVDSDSTTSTLECDERIYTVNWPYVDVKSADIPGGDLPTLLKMTITPYIVDATNNAPNEIMFSIMQFPKDYNIRFSPYLNTRNVDINPDGITVTTGTDTTFTDDINGAGTAAVVPAGRVAKYSPTSQVSNFVDRLTFNFNNRSADWAGRYRAFLRFILEPLGDVDEHQFRLLVRSGNDETTFVSKTVGSSDLVLTLDVFDVGIMDFGIIDTSVIRHIPPTATSDLFDEILNDVKVVIQSKNPDAFTTDVSFVDLVLMPVDRPNCVISGTITPNSDSLVVNSATDPRTRVKVYAKENNSNFVNGSGYVVAGHKQVSITPDHDYRIFFFVTDAGVQTGDWSYPYDGVYKFELEGVGRYMSFRGNG